MRQAAGVEAPATPAPPPGGVLGAGREEGVRPSDQPAAFAGGALISLARANSQPALFYDGDGNRRVYLSTDAVFGVRGQAITQQGAIELARVATLLAAQPRRRVQLQVHTDAWGIEQQQRALSERQAQAIFTWLTGPGHVDPARLSAIGMGASRPLVPADESPSLQQPNRRLELKLVD